MHQTPIHPSKPYSKHFLIRNFLAPETESRGTCASPNSYLPGI